MRYFITGGCGFLGSNLAEEVLKRGNELFVFDNLFREGAAENLKWLKTKGSFKHYHADTRSYNDVEFAIKEVKPDVVFHLAGQVAMTTSLLNPRLDFEINVLGGHNVLEAVRKHAPHAVITYSSTNKVYGDLEFIEYEETPTRYIANGYEKGFNESLPLHFESPYGCSKGAVDQYMLDYARMFDLKTVVFRHSSIFGGRQFSTVDQGWVGWFIKKAIEIKNGSKEPFTIAGNGKQVRDILYANDLINLYFTSVDKIEIVKGQVYNIGGGVENSLSLLELFNWLENHLDIEMKYINLPSRKSDQKVFIADTSKIKTATAWDIQVTSDDALKNMINWMQNMQH